MWGPVTNPTARALACCWGGMGVPGGGAPCLGVGRPGSGALPAPTARTLGGLPGPTTHWLWVRGGAGVGTRHQPRSARSCELAWRAVGASEGARGRPSCLGVGRPGSGALPPPTARPLGGLPGPTTHWLWARGVAGVGTRHQPHSARSCVLWGRHEGTRGGRLLPGCGASGVGRSPTPDCPPSGRTAGAHYALAVGAGGCGRGDPSPTPHRALLRAGFACCRGGMRVPGVGVSCLGVGRPGSGALPPPTARPPSGLPGPTTHWLWVRGGAGVGARHQPHSARSCELALRAVGAARGRLGGGPPAWVWGVRGQALSHPRLPALWAGCRGPLPTGCGCGGVRASGPVTNPTACAPARCGGGMRVPGGGASCLGVGGPLSGALPAPTGRPLGGLPGPTTHWLWVRGGAGVGARLYLVPCPVPRFVVCCARFPGSRHPVAVVAWHLSSCRGCGRRRASLACLVAPRWCTAPRPVRALSVLRSAFPSLWCLPPPQGLSPPALLASCEGHAEAGREPRSFCLPLARAEARALGALHVVPVRGPAIGLSLAGPSGFGLGLRALRWFGVSGFPYGPSCDGGLGRCTGAVSCGRRHTPLRVGGHPTRMDRPNEFVECCGYEASRLKGTSLDDATPQLWRKAQKPGWRMLLMPPQFPGEDDLSLVLVRRANREKDESEALARCKDYEANEARKKKET